MAVDEDDMGIDTEGDGDYAQGRDLDDDIPEGMDADSYQHTDTEVEDESSFEGERQGVLSNSVWGSGGGSGIGPVGGNPGAGAGSVNLPVGASRGGRRSGGRLGGRENWRVWGFFNASSNPCSMLINTLIKYTLQRLRFPFI